VGKDAYVLLTACLSLPERQKSCCGDGVFSMGKKFKAPSTAWGFGYLG